MQSLSSTLFEVLLYITRREGGNQCNLTPSHSGDQVHVVVSFSSESSPSHEDSHRPKRFSLSGVISIISLSMGDVPAISWSRHAMPAVLLAGSPYGLNHSAQVDLVDHGFLPPRLFPEFISGAIFFRGSAGLSSSWQSSP
jgi:hypothetical protein